MKKKTTSPIEKFKAGAAIGIKAKACGLTPHKRNKIIFKSGNRLWKKM